MAVRKYPFQGSILNSLAALALLLLCAHAHSDQHLCKDIYVQDGSLSLSRNEKLLVCGSADASEGWKEIPLTQAQYQLSVHLENHGYMHPRFERSGASLLVWKGPLSRTKTLRVNGAAGLLNADKKRKVVGKPMLPEKLDEVSRWADMSLRSQGYPCPTVQLQGQIWDESIVADVSPGPVEHVRRFDWVGLQALRSDKLLRFEAFQVGDVYDVRDLQITTSRLLNEGVLQSAYFTSNCTADGVDLTLHAEEGQPRIFRFGIGASTEEFPFVDLTYKDARLDSRGSSYTASAHASPRRQTLNFDTELYILPFFQNSYLGPRFELQRQSEAAYEELSSNLGVDVGQKWDVKEVRLDARIGPTLNYVNTIRGIGPDDVSFVSWQGKLQAMDHAYEVHVGDQFEGWTSNFQYLGQRKGLGSPLNVDRYEGTMKYLWNVGAYSPPLFVLAWRSNVAIVNSTEIESGQGRELLPIDYRIFYGGDQNLRGFARKSLDNEGKGYLTAVSSGVELRLIEELPFRLQPFLLYDAAKLGTRRLTLENAWYTSWGLGVRWPSPIGTVRASAAKGEISPADPKYRTQWVFILSLGQEF
jgi:translocation and assembly module TamA